MNDKKIKNYYLLVLIIISLINIGLNIESKYIVIDFYSKYSEENIKNNYYHNNLTKNYVYTQLKLGSNEQLLEMRLDLNNYVTYIVNQDLIKEKNKISFNPQSSNTFYNLSIAFISYTNDLYNSFISKDTLTINNKKLNDYYFAYANILNYYDDIPPGSIGFNYYKDYIIPKENLNLIDQLKNNELISGYSLTFHFTSNYKGQLYLGADMDEIFSDKYSSSDKKIIKITGGNNRIYNRWGLTFNKIKVGEDELEYSTTANFNLREDFILATDEYSEIIFSKFFSELIHQNKCIKENYSYNINAYTIKCKKDTNIKHFPVLDFLLSDVDMEPFHLIFDYNSLFDVIGEYLYFKIILINRFDPTISVSIEWTFGKTFFKKHIMTLNKDKKTITFYNETNNSNNENTKEYELKNKNKNAALIILSIILFILVLSTFFLLKKCIHQQIEINKRKKKNILVTEMSYYQSDI